MTSGAAEPREDSSVEGAADATGEAHPLTLPGRAVTVELARDLLVPEQFARALWRARGRAQGRLSDRAHRGLGPIEVVRRGLRLDRARIERFRSVCADRGASHRVPAVFLETLFLSPMAAIALHRTFPFSPLGLVHLRQRLRQHRAVTVGERLDLHCTLSALRETGRGYEVDCAMELDSAGERVWQGLATLLSRNRATRGRGARRRGGSRGDEAGALGRSGDPKAEFQAPADLGRRYAAASGDYNPHHLYPLTARLVGFKRPIAQGIWTLARSLAALGASDPAAERLVVEASFKRPVYLPGRVAVGAGPGDPSSEAGLSFEVYDPGTDAPHVVGSVRW